MTGSDEGPLRKRAMTAISRKKVSAPAKYLMDEGLIKGHVLDFGCGRGDLEIASHPEADVSGWDPYWKPSLPSRSKYDVVTCIYVLNVQEPGLRRRALASAKRYVKKGGALYVAVRRDVDGPTGGQFDVRLDMESIKLKASKYEIYRWFNGGPRE